MKRSFVRIEVPGVMIYWLGDSPIAKKNPLGYAVVRVKASTSSALGCERREHIDPNNRQRLKKFMAAVSRRSPDIIISHHTYDGKVGILTKELNDQELYDAAIKQVPVYSLHAAAAYAFRKECAKSLKP